MPNTSKIEFFNEKPTASSYSNSTRSSSSHSTSSCSTSIESTSSGSTATTGGTYTIGVGNFDALQDLRRRIPLQLLPPISILARQAAWIFQIPIVIQPVLILPVPPRKNEDVLQLAHEGDEANIHSQLGFLICLVDNSKESFSRRFRDPLYFKAIVNTVAMLLPTIQSSR